MKGRTRVVSLAGAAALALGATGCGSDDFENELRPPPPVELTAKVDSDKVKVSPSELGAGLAVITIANLTDTELQVSFDGPSTDVTDPIGSDSVQEFQILLEEGTYEVTAGADARADEIEVGPPRDSGQNQLLLP